MAVRHGKRRSTHWCNTCIWPVVILSIFYCTLCNQHSKLLPFPSWWERVNHYSMESKPWRWELTKYWDKIISHPGLTFTQWSYTICQNIRRWASFGVQDKTDDLVQSSSSFCSVLNIRLFYTHFINRNFISFDNYKTLSRINSILGVA